MRNFIAVDLAEPLPPDDPRALSRAFPPGAVNAERFSSRCVACHACVHVCPVGIIRADGAPQPKVIYGVNYCQFNCVECGKVCPTDAITKLDVDTKHRTRIALSRLSLPGCVVVAKGQACGACAEVCPTHALSMIRYEDHPELTMPSFDEDYCVGCGACAAVCPAEPVAFEIRGVMVQSLTPGLRSAAEEQEDESAVPMTAGDDFPF